RSADGGNVSLVGRIPFFEGEAGIVRALALGLRLRQGDERAVKPAKLVFSETRPPKVPARVGAQRGGHGGGTDTAQVVAVSIYARHQSVVATVGDHLWRLLIYDPGLIGAAERRTEIQRR